MRPAVSRFADMMDEQLTLHAEERGECSWRGVETHELVSSLNRHLVKAGAAMRNKNKDESVKQLAHAANFLMMITDNIKMGTEGVPPPDSDGS